MGVPIQRMERHIEEGYEETGASEKEAERRAWATVNMETGPLRGERLIRDPRGSGPAPG